MKTQTRHYFLSDAHFGSGFGSEKERITLFERFCDTIIGTDCTVIIPGDFFDFWIDYKTVIRSDYLKVVAALYNLTRSNIPVTFIRGNHDFMSYSFFSNELGCTVLDGHNVLNYNGIQLYICHGDDLRGDWKYRFLHRFLKNPLAQKLYCSLHPNFGIGLAESLSQLSRKNSGKSGRYLSDERQSWYHTKADSLLETAKADIFIMGHTHRANITKLANGVYANCGAWLDGPTFLMLDHRTLSLQKLTDNAKYPFEKIDEVQL